MPISGAPFDFPDEQPGGESRILQVTWLAASCRRPKGAGQKPAAGRIARAASSGK